MSQSIFPKFMLPKFISYFVLFLLGLSLSPSSQAAETVCNNNGGAGFPIAITSVSNIPVNFNFGDEGFLIDVNVFVDIQFPWVGDLSATMTNPVGTSVLLFHRPGLPGPPTPLGPPYGCTGDDINATFDDESTNGRLEADTCGNLPAYGGPSYTVHNEPTTNPLSDLDGEEVSGLWTFTFENAERFDVGTMQNVCITAQFAAVTFDQWVSTTPSCNDQVDSLDQTIGSDIYVCYTLSNPGDEAFTLGDGDWIDTLGNDLASLEGSYSAGASQTVNFGPFVAGSAPFFQGVTIGNSEVTVSGGVNFPSILTTETIAVNASNALPGSAAKPLYLYNNQSISRVAPVATQNELNFNELQSRTFTMTPALVRDLILDTANDITLSLFLRELGTGTTRDISFTVSGSSSGTIATLNQNLNLTNTTSLYNITLAYVAGVPALLNAGETITLTVRNNTTGSGNRRVLLTPANPLANNSTIFLPTNTIINVDSISVYDLPFADPASTSITGAQAGDIVYVRAQVSDPFGTFDITSISNTFTDPATTVQATNLASTVIIDDVASGQKTYEIPFTIPPFPVLGDWRIDIEALEGLVSEGITHANFVDFLVLAPPSLSVVKTATTSSPGFVNPGEMITYGITVSNSGLGVATDIVLDDTPSGWADIDEASFLCSSGCPASGVTMGVPTFNYGLDGDIIDWNLIMGGTLTGGQAFSIEYQAEVE